MSNDTKVPIKVNNKKLRNISFEIAILGAEIQEFGLNMNKADNLFSLDHQKEFDVLKNKMREQYMKLLKFKTNTLKENGY